MVKIWLWIWPKIETGLKFEVKYLTEFWRKVKKFEVKSIQKFRSLDRRYYTMYMSKKSIIKNKKIYKDYWTVYFAIISILQTRVPGPLSNVFTPKRHNLTFYDKDKEDEYRFNSPHFACLKNADYVIR